MIVKTIKKADVDIDGYETEYFGNVKKIIRFEPCLEQKEKIADTIELFFNDNSSRLMVVGTIEKDKYKKEYNSVFLMNDKGETIERII